MRSRTARDRGDRGDRGDRNGNVFTSASRETLVLGPADAVVASGLDEAIAAIRCRTARLAYEIIRREYLNAWCEACDLNRAIDRADVLAFVALELPEDSDGVRRLDEARDEAETVLQLAPAPTTEAIRLAFSLATTPDFTLWDQEAEQWLAKLAAHKPPKLGANLTRKPKVGAALRTNTARNR